MRRTITLTAAGALTAMVFVATAAADSKTSEKAQEKAKIIEVAVTKKGFEPNSIEVAPGTPVTLKVTRKTDSTCAKKLTVADSKEETELPLNKPVLVKLGIVKEGEVKFGCSMGQMLSAVVVAK